ncbi:extracellular solute-binding protein [Paenibacillus solisilvae]|uniref:Extracellular solute-binding protein n=1 Tax=Paenibacillus solisilvae TaxID=2486751 RepID=A0ABW0VU52_9BACL
MRRENEFRYTQLASILREQIISGYIKPGEFILSENDLCRYYGMSRTSVRKSLDNLLKEGLIVKKAGLGTIVSPDLIIDEPGTKVLRILATSPSHFMDICMPMIIEEFQKHYPNVKVKCLGFPTEEFWESVRASNELGLQADIILVGDRQLIEMEDAGPFIDLKEPMKDIFQGLYPTLRSAFSSIKAIPVTFSSVYLVYNPNLFQKYNVPLPKHDWTREDFLRAAQLLTMDTDSDGIVDQYGFALSPAINRWTMFALQNGVNFKEDVQREALVKTLTFLHDLLYRYRIATLLPKQQLNLEVFIREKAAMVLTTAIELAGWRNEKLQFEPRVASMPFGDTQAPLLIANAMMIPEGCNDEEMAIRFLKFALSYEIQEKISRNKHFLSVLESVNEAIWDKTTLLSLNIVNDRLSNSRFLNEIFPDLGMLEEIESEMALYWAGLESANHFADWLLGMIARQEKKG